MTEPIKTEATLVNPIVDLNVFLRAHMDVLANAVDEASATQIMQAWLHLQSNRPVYSPRNCWLALFQDPEATWIGPASYWRVLGRDLVPVAQPIWIQAPAFVATKQANDSDLPVRVGQSDDETPTQPVLVAPGYTRRRKTGGLRRLIYFIDVPVYDLRHTQGDPLPEPEWRSLARRADLEIHLEAFAHKYCIEVKREQILRGALGFAAGGAITLAPSAGTSVFVHELMHEMLHQRQRRETWLPTHVREWQAEIGAYLVCAHFGIPNLNAPTYLAGWTASGKQVRKQFEAAANPARQMIQFVEARMGLRDAGESLDAVDGVSDE